mgnify:CR=1 FL=1
MPEKAKRFFIELYRKQPTIRKIVTLGRWLQGEKEKAKIPEAYEVPGDVRRPYIVAKNVAEEFVEKTKEFYSKVDVAGSVRRRTATVKDTDIVAVLKPGNLNRLVNRLEEMGALVYNASDKQVSCLYKGFKVTVYFAKPEYYGSMLLVKTGPAEENIKHALAAKKKGWKFSQYGVFDRQGRRIAGKTEEEVFKALGEEYVPPEKRGEEEKAQIEPSHAQSSTHIFIGEGENLAKKRRKKASFDRSAAAKKAWERHRAKLLQLSLIHI